MTNTEITKKAADYISNLFKTKLPHKYTYHIYDHTLEVVENCKWIGTESDLNDKELEIVILAAWFHDSGYIEKYDDHEEISIELITGFLQENTYPEDRIRKAINCIKATKIPQNPQNLLE